MMRYARVRLIRRGAAPTNSGRRLNAVIDLNAARHCVVWVSREQRGRALSFSKVRGEPYNYGTGKR